MNRYREQYWLGLDYGTSGARAIAINRDAVCMHEQALEFGSAQDARSPQVWRSLLFELIAGVPQSLRSHLAKIAINGTSSTLLLCDSKGTPLLPPMMYGDQGDRVWVEQLTQISPAGHCVQSASSSLVKLLTLQTAISARYCLHQADWLAFLLHGQLGVSDYHNSLKLGYDPAAQSYPFWFEHPLLDPVRSLLPRVVPPGTTIGSISPEVALPLGLPDRCQICAGTTDSIAAFLASTANQPGDAVTSLGSTLVLKLLSPQRVDRSEYGIYSHRLGQLWLVGGASNTGGAVLAHFFAAPELTELSQHIHPNAVSPLSYYPLLKPGERFPINNPDLQPCLVPRPESSVEFLHGLLESLARIEAKGYRLLEQCGAAPLKQVFTAGGGAKNPVWQSIRQRHLDVPVYCATQEQAAYGTARLALHGVGYAEAELL